MSRGNHTQTERVHVPLWYKVRGSVAFPLDMLRYDAAWPVRESDAHTIARTIQGLNDTPVSVFVYSRKPLTVERWSSQGWIVLATGSSRTWIDHEKDAP